MKTLLRSLLVVSALALPFSAFADTAKPAKPAATSTAAKADKPATEKKSSSHKKKGAKPAPDATKEDHAADGK